MSTGVDYFSTSVTNYACSCGTTYFQETYPEQLFKDCSHYRGVISEADQMLMNDAERVTILTGAGCEGSHDELLQIVEHLQAPVVHAF